MGKSKSAFETVECATAMLRVKELAEHTEFDKTRISHHLDRAFFQLIRIGGRDQKAGDFVILTLDNLLLTKCRDVVRDLAVQVDKDARHFECKALSIRVNVFLKHLKADADLAKKNNPAYFSNCVMSPL